MTQKLPWPKAKPNCRFGKGTEKAATGTGGLMMIKATMQAPMKTPCAECPLRRDSAAGYLGGYTPEMYLDALHGPASIACHKSPGFQQGDIASQRHCTGVAAYRANVGHVCHVDGQLTGAEGASHLVGPDKEHFFDTPESFVAHHGAAQKSR